MKYKKIKDDKGDFHSFDAGVLYKALIAELGEPGTPQAWYLSTNEVPGVVHLIVHDENLDTSGVDKVMKDHFKEDWTDYDPEVVAKDELMAKIDSATTIKDLKDILKEELK